jgi:hypothetical protein
VEVSLTAKQAGHRVLVLMPHLEGVPRHWG